jgi:hypothetical protein
MISKIETPSFPNLDAAPMTGSVSSSVAASLSPLLGTGGGAFGNPTLNDMIGTAGGRGHTTSFNTIVAAHTRILSMPVGKTLKTAGDTLALDPTIPQSLTDFLNAQAVVV